MGSATPCLVQLLRNAMRWCRAWTQGHAITCWRLVALTVVFTRQTLLQRIRAWTPWCIARATHWWTWRPWNHGSENGAVQGFQTKPLAVPGQLPTSTFQTPENGTSFSPVAWGLAAPWTPSMSSSTHSPNTRLKVPFTHAIKRWSICRLVPKARANCAGTSRGSAVSRHVHKTPFGP